MTRDYNIFLKYTQPDNWCAKEDTDNLSLYNPEGKVAIVLYDNSFPTHIGALIQDENGVWWHYYWGKEFSQNMEKVRV